MLLVCMVSQNCVTAGEVEGSTAEKGSSNKLSIGISPLARDMTGVVAQVSECLVEMDN